MSSLFEVGSVGSEASEHYVVLARKYRPMTFHDMIGQHALVQTFTNAIASGRIAHAFLLTGIRGVGKTTTARIIARALNCIGSSGEGGVTIAPCGECYHCKAILSDKHQDVIEIDAASHTGVDDMREIIENARYRPIAGRYKVYIIDEVHMLSNSAFNALLKTLEEPPQHVKFIFATTEIKKIPLTILSRCQRFDLKRVEVEELVEYFNTILNKEGFKAEHEAVRMIATAAQGSVRDGLSILDQAIAHTSGNVDADSTKEMLGLASRYDIYKLFEYLVLGDINNCLREAGSLYYKGSDPALLLEDMLEITHTIAKLKINSEAISELISTEQEVVANILRATDISKISRIWMAMLKGLEEVKQSFNPMIAFEMVIIRVINISNLPSPDEIAGKIKSNPDAVQHNNKKFVNEDTKISGSLFINNVDDIGNALFNAGEMVLYHHLRNDVEIVSVGKNQIQIKVHASAPKDFTTRLKNIVESVTKEVWVVEAVEEGGTGTIAQQAKLAKTAREKEVMEHPYVKKMVEVFEGIQVSDIKLKEVV